MYPRLRRTAMASLSAAGHLELEQPRSGLMLSFVLLAAVLAAAEFAVGLVPQYLFVSLGIDSRGPPYTSPYDLLDAVLRFTLVPLALFLAFYLLASRRDIDLRRSYLSIALSIF